MIGKAVKEGARLKVIFCCAWDGSSFRHWSQRDADRSEKYFLAFILEDWLDWKSTKYLESVHFYYKTPLNSHLRAHEQSAETFWEIQATIYTEAGQVCVIIFLLYFLHKRKPTVNQICSFIIISYNSVLTCRKDLSRPVAGRSWKDTYFGPYLRGT